MTIMNLSYQAGRTITEGVFMQKVCTQGVAYLKTMQTDIFKWPIQWY